MYTYAPTAMPVNYAYPQVQGGYSQPVSTYPQQNYGYGRQSSIFNANDYNTNYGYQTYNDTTNYVNNNYYVTQPPQPAQPNVNVTNIYNNYDNDIYAYPGSYVNNPTNYNQGNTYSDPYGHYMFGSLTGTPGALPATQGNQFDPRLFAMFAAQLNAPTTVTEEIITDVDGSAWGDPHFDVKNSKGENMRTDHKGKDDSTYRIFDAQGGDGITVDAKYVKYGDTNNPQVMDKIRITAGEQEILVNQDGTVTLDDKILEKDKSYTLEDGTKIDINKKGEVDIHSKEKDATMHITQDRSGKEKQNFLNVDVEGSWSNGTQQVGGVLGMLNQNKDNLSIIGDGKKVNDINGDGIKDDLDGDNFIEDFELAKLGYNFELTGNQAIL